MSSATSETSTIEWHRLPDKPNEGEMVILEILGDYGRGHHVRGVGLYRDGAWDFRGSLFSTAILDDRVVRWARFPEPSWKEEL